jgi:TrmH family RNA methyltransferase
LATKKIAPLSKALEKKINSLKTPEGRLELGQFIVEGPHLIEEAISTRQNFKVLVYLDEAPIDSEEKLGDIERFAVTFSQLKKLSGLQNPTGPLAVLEIPKAGNWEGQPVICCDQIQDPGNVGSIIRSAAAAGFAVVLSPGCADLYNLKTIRATQGALFKTAVIKTENTLAFLKKAKGEGYRLFSLMPSGGAEFSSVKYPKRSVIIVGNEGAGLASEIVELTEKVKITLENNVESLNASIAAALVMFETKKDK